MPAQHTTVFAPTAYKPAAPAKLLSALAAPWRVLHAIQWNAPWDR